MQLVTWTFLRGNIYFNENFQIGDPVILMFNLKFSRRAPVGKSQKYNVEAGWQVSSLIPLLEVVKHRI